MLRSVLDYTVKYDNVDIPEPTLRQLVFEYYDNQFLDKDTAMSFAREFCADIERFEKTR